MASAARSAGYDTIQFTNYDSEGYADYEIWDLATGLTAGQSGPCLDGATPGVLTAGWAGSGGDCRCDASLPWLNCMG